MFECYCPCQCGCKTQERELCQDCLDGNHEVMPEGIFPGVEQYYELHKSIVSQYERVLYTRKTFIGKLEYLLQDEFYFTLQEAEDLSDAIHIAESTGYEINEEEDNLWIKLSDKIIDYRTNHGLGIATASLRDFR